jgi:SOS-response transcriptional repressor LexA
MSKLRNKSRYDLGLEVHGEEVRDTILNFIIAYKTGHDGCSPSIREIMRECGLLSTNTVNYHLARMEKDGSIRRNGIRGIEVVGGTWFMQGDEDDEEGAYPVPALRKHEVQESA